MALSLLSLTSHFLSYLECVEGIPEIISNFIFIEVKGR
jgi:hypothetical protein